MLLLIKDTLVEKGLVRECCIDFVGERVDFTVSIVIVLRREGPSFYERVSVSKASFEFETVALRIQEYYFGIFLSGIKWDPIASFVKVVIETKKSLRRVISEAGCRTGLS